MIYRALFFSFCVVLCFFATAQPKGFSAAGLDKLNNEHDITAASAWGPYGKKYAGISHLPDLRSGRRMDFSVLPGYYRNRMLIPNVNFESGYFPWMSNDNGTTYTFRYELEWKDRVYTDVTYDIQDSTTVRVSIKCVNNTSSPQNLALNLIAFMAYPDLYPEVTLDYPAGSLWFNGVDYQQVHFFKKTPQDHLVYDGWMLGEVRNKKFIQGSALGKDFGVHKDDYVSYYRAGMPSEGTLSLVYQLAAGKTCPVTITGVTEPVILTGNGALAVVSVPYRPVGDTAVVIKSLGGDAVVLNGILLSPGEHPDIAIKPQSPQFQPQLSEDPAGRSLILKYRDIDNYYGLTWDNDNFTIRQFLHDELDIYMRYYTHNHVSSIFEGNKEGHFSNVFIRPVVLGPRSSQTLNVLIATGNSPDVVKRRLADLGKQDEAVLAAKASGLLPAGEKYGLSLQLFKATLMTNIVYPVYTQKSYIRHFTPGKWWNSLYTWDLGFTALGLNDVNPALAIDCINAYTTSADAQSAFIHHGSLVPTQFYALFDLYNKMPSRDLLHYFYPRLKRYYNFFAGKEGGSSTNALGSNLLKTWDYFYNSGGWDDYPPQVAVHQSRSEATVTPVITTAQCIRVAKLLAMTAEKLGFEDDVVIYKNDVKRFEQALQTVAWDSSSGYYGYVRHDSLGRPVSFFKYNGLTNYNMGLDGAYPLFAGICTGDQTRTLLEKLFSPKHLWTSSGMGVVDQAAPYYRQDGYWNGAVWMPHQWLMWKTMLDLGRSDLAFTIAHTALDLYNDEVRLSYYTFEHFLAASRRGAGWHQFSGLSTPILNWITAYYRPGTVSAGFEVLISSSKTNELKNNYRAELTFDKLTPPHERSMLACLNPTYHYEARFNGRKIDVQQRYPGLLELTLPATNSPGELIVVGIKGK
ncbi:MAG: hypothetical protein J0H74_35905 [Chitinophagaceae bacterium]|nr:hypothetical protein [Chitinophagaceae bacterium]